MEQDQGGGRGPQPNDDKSLADVAKEDAVKPSQRDGHHPKVQRDISRGAEPATGGASRQRS